MVAGYTVKREYVNVEFSAGIENIGYDAIAGLRFADLRPHGEAQGLSLERLAGARHRTASPAAAWNPIGGMTDPFGRLMGFAVGDPALHAVTLRSGLDAQPHLRSSIRFGATMTRSARHDLASAAAMHSCWRMSLAGAHELWPPARAEVTFALRIENGHVPDNMRLIRVKQNDVVKLHWTTDRPMTVHLHGYDIEKEVEPGTVTEMAFTARATGRFTVEPHVGEDAVRRPRARGRPCHASRSILDAAPGAPLRRRSGGLRVARCCRHAGVRPRLRPALRSADSALVLSVRSRGGGRGLVRHRRAVRARASARRMPIRVSICLPRRSGRWIAEPSPWLSRSSSSRCRRFHRHDRRRDFAATRTPTTTSRRPWCGSSGGSGSPMFPHSSATSGRSINPWRTIFESVETIYARHHRRRRALAATCPIRQRSASGRRSCCCSPSPGSSSSIPNPAVPRFIAWLAVAYSHPDLRRHVRVRPRDVAASTARFSRWCSARSRALRRSRCAPGRNRELRLRPFGAGLLDSRAVSTSMMAFVLLLLATVLYDGALGTPEWGQLESTLAPTSRARASSGSWRSGPPGSSRSGSCSSAPIVGVSAVMSAVAAGRLVAA